MFKQAAAIAAAGAFTVLGGIATAGTGDRAAGQMTMSGQMRHEGRIALNATDRQFMMKAAQGNIAEIKLGQLALKKSQSERVRALAQTIIQGHTKGHNELKQVAMQHNVKLPQDTDARHKAMYNRMARMSPAQFDRMYVAGQARDHVATIRLFQTEIRGGQEAHIKALAAKQLPEIEGHTGEIVRVAEAMEVTIPQPAKAYRSRRMPGMQPGAGHMNNGQM